MYESKFVMFYNLVLPIVFPIEDEHMIGAQDAVIRTGLTPGRVFLKTVLQGLLAAVVLGGGLALCYFAFFYRGPVLCCGPAAAHLGGGGSAGAVLVLLMFLMGILPLLIGIVLALFSLLYVWLGFFYGGRRALACVVNQHSLAVGDRLAATVVSRLSAVPPGGKVAAASIRKWISEDNVAQKLESVVGSDRWSSRIVRFAARRLPWNKLLNDLNAAEKDQKSAALQSVLGARIATAIDDAVQPSVLMLAVVLILHALLFGFCVWLLI